MKKIFIKIKTWIPEKNTANILNVIIGTETRSLIWRVVPFEMMDHIVIAEIGEWNITTQFLVFINVNYNIWSTHYTLPVNQQIFNDAKIVLKTGKKWDAHVYAVWKKKSNNTASVI